MSHFPRRASSDDAKPILPTLGYGMPFEPDFMRAHPQYLEEKARIRTVDDWRRFSHKWFNSDRWPDKTREQLVAEAESKHGPLRLGGRLWGYTYYLKDISAEARHELFSTRHSIGDPLQAPHMFEPPRWRRWRRRDWSLECGFCEIATFDNEDVFPGACPRCGRSLYWVTPGE